MEAVKQVFFGCALVRRIDFWYCNRFPSILDFHLQTMLCSCSQDSTYFLTLNEYNLKMNLVHLLYTFSIRLITLMQIRNGDKYDIPEFSVFEEDKT